MQSNRTNKSVSRGRLALNLKVVCSKRRESWKASEGCFDYSIKPNQSSDGQSSVGSSPMSSPIRLQDDSDKNEFVTVYDRNDACSWIHQNGVNLKMGPDTICLAYSILDRMLSVLKVRRRLLRVLVAASLSLAAKFTEDETRNQFARFLLDACGLTFSFRDLTRMELLVCSKLEWNLHESTPIEFLYSFFDILAAGRDFPSPHQRKAVSSFLASRLVDFNLAKLPNMEIALGCIFVVFGGRGMSRLRLLLTTQGINCDFNLAQEAGRLLKPHAKVSMRLVSKFIQMGEEDKKETELLFSVKKLLSYGHLEPIKFGQKTFAEVVRC